MAAASADAPAARRPLVTVATVVEDGGRFLFVEERVRGELVLNQPAGHLDPGEDLVDAAVRETLEETAWRVAPQALVAIHQWRSPADGAEFVRFTFAADPVAHEVGRALDAGIERAVWLRPEELDTQVARPRSPLVRRAIEDYLAGVRWPLAVLRRLGPG
jgi:8-oxo-dGTP pyrophosphatase MutT (NUDIX family)